VTQLTIARFHGNQYAGEARWTRVPAIAELLDVFFISSGDSSCFPYFHSPETRCRAHMFTGSPGTTKFGLPPSSLDSGSSSNTVNRFIIIIDFCPLGAYRDQLILS
jgi:hypothetical protein